VSPGYHAQLTLVDLMQRASDDAELVRPSVQGQDVKVQWMRPLASGFRLELLAAVHLHEKSAFDLGE
jgi:hypothetical protein